MLLRLTFLQFFCFPPVLPVTASLMSTRFPFSSTIKTDTNLDYVSAVIGIFAIFLIGYWLLYGKKTFQGPVSLILSYLPPNSDKSVQELDIILGERPELSEATDELAMEEKKLGTPKQ
jgi:hypothetical protein